MNKKELKEMIEKSIKSSNNDKSTDKSVNSSFQTSQSNQNAQSNHHNQNTQTIRINPFQTTQPMQKQKQMTQQIKQRGNNPLNQPYQSLLPSHLTQHQSRFPQTPLSPYMSTNIPLQHPQYQTKPMQYSHSMERVKFPQLQTQLPSQPQKGVRMINPPKPKINKMQSQEKSNLTGCLKYSLIYLIDFYCQYLANDSLRDCCILHCLVVYGLI